MNELLLAVSVVFIFGTVLLAYMLFGRGGLYAVSSLAAVFANIEALILIEAFGMEQTLGNYFLPQRFWPPIFCRNARAGQRQTRRFISDCFPRCFL